MNLKQRAAFLSVLSNSGLLLLKIAVGLLINSISVISEAIHSAMDLVSSLIAFFAVGKSSQPADPAHPYGHGKLESLSGIIEAGLIALVGGFIIWESIDRLLDPKGLRMVSLGMGVMGISALVNLLVYRHNLRVARATGSMALEANAAHLKVDALTSLGVALGLALILLTHFEALDPLGAIGVACYVLKAGFELIRKAFRDLMDRKLPEEEERAILTILRDHHPQFVEFHKLRTRRSGPERYIDLHLVFDKTIGLRKAHDLCSHIEEEIKVQLPRSHIIIHIEPCEITCQGCPKTCTQNPNLL